LPYNGGTPDVDQIVADSPELASVAEEARARLERVIETVEATP